jgi:hypothetical protein
MKTLLTQKYGLNDKQIIVLTDELHDMQPTKNNIIRELEIIVQNSRSVKEVWIFYSGHGSQYPSIKDADGMIEVIIPIDYRENGVITDIDLHEILERIYCKALLLFDSCHSGTICNMPWIYEITSNVNYKITHKKELEMKNKEIYVFSACKDDQTSIDEYNEEGRQYEGVFTECFLQCLYSNSNSKPIIIFYRDLVLLMENKGYSQIPILSTSGNALNYDFEERINSFV